MACSKLWRYARCWEGSVKEGSMESVRGGSMGSVRGREHGVSEGRGAWGQ